MTIKIILKKDFQDCSETASRRDLWHGHTLQVDDNFLVAGEEVSEMSESQAVISSLEAPVLLSRVVGQFDKLSQHEGLHCHAAHDLVSV